MVQLKEHMLREIATDLCGRVEPYFLYKNQNLLFCVENFIFSGKEPARVFRRIIGNDITITEVTPGRVRMEYRDGSWWYYDTYSDIFIIWAKKACLQDFDWLYDSPKLGYSKRMMQKNGVEELGIEYLKDKAYLPQILKAFPKLVILKLTANNFASMLSVAPTELISLQEVELRVLGGAYEFHAAHKALSEHQNKLPALDTIHYVDTPMKDIKFPDDAENVLSIKNLKINGQTNCWTPPFDYSFLLDAQKMFPSLESVEICASVHCSWKYNEHKTLKMEVVESFYEAFESLSLGFSIKVTYTDTFSCFEKDLAELRQFFATKGNVYGSFRKFAVETSVPGKRLTYEVTVLPGSDCSSDAEDDY